jgi:hypothetical protein
LIRRRPRAADEAIDVAEVAPAPARAAADAEPPADPSRLQGNETLYGYVVALELMVVAILNLVVIHGKGAPQHPDTTLSVLGVVAAVALIAVLQLRKRTVAAFTAILAAFVVTLPKVPTSLTFYHFFALAIAAGWGLVIATRRRKAEKAGLASGGASAARTSRRETAPAGRKPKEKSRRGAPAPSGPQANRRYTPPKPKRRSSGRTSG